MPGAGLTWLDRLDRSQAGQLVALFDREWWTTGRDLAGVERMLAGSAEVVGVLDGAELVAFGRSFADGVYMASINDVIVSERRRGEGLGTAVVEELLRRPAVAGAELVTLHCLAEMIPYYERLGFSKTDPRLHRMEIRRRPGGGPLSILARR